MTPRCTLIIPTHKPEIYRKWEENLEKHPAGEAFYLVKLDTSQIPLEDLYMTKIMNDAMKAVQTEYTCTTCDDVYPLTDRWLSTMIRELAIYKLATINPYQLKAGIKFKEVPQALEMHCKHQKQNKYANGACSVFRTAQARQIGFFDENYRWTYVDMDFSFRMEKFGCHAYTLSVVAEHDGQTTARRDEEPYRTWVRQSYQYMVKKWGKHI